MTDLSKESATTKDELPDDVFVRPPGKRSRMWVRDGLLFIRSLDVSENESEAVPFNNDQLRQLARNYAHAPLGWPRALAYYDEQVGRQKEDDSGEPKEDECLSAVSATVVGVSAQTALLRFDGPDDSDRPVSTRSFAFDATCGDRVTMKTMRRGDRTRYLVIERALSGGDSGLLRDIGKLAASLPVNHEADREIGQLLTSLEGEHRPIGQSAERPSYIPPNAPWTWVTDGLGRQVGAWACVAGGELCVSMWNPKKEFGWFWALSCEDQWRDSFDPAMTPAAALQCRALYDRCVVDDEGRVWEMSRYFDSVKFVSGEDNWVLSTPIAILDWPRFCAGGITAPGQVAKVRAFVEAQKDSGPEAKQTTEDRGSAGVLRRKVHGVQSDPERTENQDAVPTEADEQSSSVGTCPECDGSGKTRHTYDGSEIPCPECQYDDLSLRPSAAKDARPMDELEPPFAGMVWDDVTDDDGEPVHRLTIGPLDLHRYRDGLVIFHQVPDYHDAALLLTDLTRALVGVVPLEDYAKAIPLHEIHAWPAKLESERDTALARAEKAEKHVASVDTSNEFLRERCANLRRDLTSPPLDALLATLSKALPGTSISPKNAREALELVVRERDEAKGRAEKAEAAASLRSAQVLAIGSVLCGDDKLVGRGDPRWTPSLDEARRLIRERNEAQARVRELEAEVEEANDRASKWETSSLSEHERHKQTESQLASVTAQRDRAWDTNEILKAQLEEMAKHTRQLADSFNDLLESQHQQSPHQAPA